MARLINEEFNNKVTAVNQAIDNLIEQSNKTNLCTVPKVVKLANEYIEKMGKGYSNLSRSTIDGNDKYSTKKEEWKEAHRRITENRELWRRSGSIVEQRIKASSNRSDKYESLCKEQNISLLACNQEILQLRKELKEQQESNVKFLKQLEEFGVNNVNGTK